MDMQPEPGVTPVVPPLIQAPGIKSRPKFSARIRVIAAGAVLSAAWYIGALALAALALPPSRGWKDILAPFAISLLLGGIGSAVAHRLFHRQLRRAGIEVERSEAHERVWWLPVVGGLIERSLITVMVGYGVSGAGGFIAGWLAIKAAAGWKDWSQGAHDGRARIFVALVSAGVSNYFGIIGGLMLTRAMAIH